ncbi:MULTISPECIES: stage II sporulation protein M [Variovorax]|uniref:stage II sporulation protein M n=1 Tax=Variovorax TaxID=34072 RepID=UPI0021AD19A1|nr:stage II sporulation protein M [Variovorax paradoxus]UVH58102.1 stage II sporulation protein M [Variovorax paradoxus]
MTPLDFEAAYAPLWTELEAVIRVAETKRKFDGARLATLYRRVCEHLALAQARAYPIHLTQRLESLTQSAHRLIYRQHDYGLARFARLALVDFPEAVRAHRIYLLVATLMFVLPLLAAGWAAYRDPGFILHLLDASSVQQFDSMYGDSAESLGRTRSAGDDWQMFGFYIMNNIGIGFRCFAAGIFAGVGSAVVVVFNGVQIGAVGGYLIAAGHAENFCSFVITHSAFELTAIVLAGAAGLRLGYAWVAPGRYTRLESLRLAARHAVVIVYGVFGLLLLAAAIEAFWSSARWIAPAVKYGVGGACWVLVLAYLGWQGRPRATAATAKAEDRAG